MYATRKRKWAHDSGEAVSNTNIHNTSDSAIELNATISAAASSSLSPDPDSHTSTATSTAALQLTQLSSQQRTTSPETPQPESDPTKPPHLSTPSNNPRHTKLQHQITNIQTQITEAQTQLSSKLAELRSILPPVSTPSPENSDTDKQTLTQAQAVVQNHIRLLTRYNEIKDVGLFLMGLLADKNGTRLSEVMADFDITEDD